jgi:hypothetical protein
LQQSYINLVDKIYLDERMNTPNLSVMKTATANGSCDHRTNNRDSKFIE